MQRDLFKQRIQRAEAELGGIPDESQDIIAPLSMAPPPRSGGRRRSSAMMEPVSWDTCFDQKLIVTTGRGEFTTYFSPPGSTDAPVFIYVHGAGSSALTFGLLAKNVKSAMATTGTATATKKDDNGVPGALAFDMRGHGETKVVGDEKDFALDTLTSDLVEAIEQFWRSQGWNDEEQQPPVVLVGHSLGGSIVCEAALTNKIKRLVGVVVLDVVEVLALESLNSMNKVLSTFPRKFDSLESAISWHVTHHHLRNPDSARISIPPLFKQTGNEFEWVMDLRATEPYWTTWFEGLSSKFLKAPAARLLILAGTDRLDKQLMIGQMQGKYQLVVFPETGHFLHEDAPQKTAHTLVDFWTRNGRPANIVPAFGKFRS